MPVDNPDDNTQINNVDPVPLFAEGAEYPVWLRTMMLATRGKVAGNDDVPMSARGYVRWAGGVPLYTQGSPFGQQFAEGVSPFSTSGREQAVSSTTLVTSGPVPSSRSAPLFVQVATPKFASVPLYAMNGVRTTGAVGLSATGGTRPNGSGSVNLSARGGGTSSSNSLGLAAGAAGAGGGHASIGLVARGGHAASARSVTLWVAAERPASGSVALFARGPAGRPGALPASGSLGLRVERGPSGGISLVVNGNARDSRLGLCTRGAVQLPGGIPLVTRGGDKFPSRSATLAVPSTTLPAPSTRSVPLSVRSAKGVGTRSATLATQGWNPE